MNMKRRSRYLYAFMAALVATILGFSACAQGSPSSVGKAGSLARFAVYDNYLYTLSPHTLTVFDIESKFEPLTVGTVNANENLETIFPYKDRLFLGTREGLNIYSLKVPRSPQFIGKFGHIVSCDPVVVEDDIAYVTLRRGGRCQRGANELQILYVGQPEKPQLLARHPFSNPGGLGIDKKRLYLMDGVWGLKILDVRNPYVIKEIGSYPMLGGYDVIPNGNLLIAVSGQGIFFFDSSNLPLIKLSQIDIAW
jgi:hypothetical protein